MHSWSSVCSFIWGKMLSSLLLKNPSTKHALPERSVSIYYLLPSANLCKNSDQTRKYFQVLKKYIQPNMATVYPLSLEDFMKGLWQSSSKLFVLYEDARFNTLNISFISQLKLISQFLASGGRVLLLLHNSSKNDHKQKSTTLWTLITAPDSRQHFAEKTDGALWSWKYVEDKTGRHGLLIGDPLHSINSSTMHQLVIISADAVDESNGGVLHEALSFTGVENTYDDSNGSTIPTCLHESSTSKTLYCMPLLAEYEKTLQLIGSAADASSQPIRMLDASVAGEVTSLPSGFHWSEYSSTLETRHLGRMPIWAESMKSSWSLTEKLLASLSPNSGLLVTSNLQESGQGRGSNQWITPLGQAAFTFHMTVESGPDWPGSVSQSELMRLVVCSQHLVSLAIVLTCRRLLGEVLGLLPEATVSTLDEEVILDLTYQGPEIRIKWPNDVYVVDRETSEPDKILVHNRLRVLGKLAGVITKGSTFGPERSDLLIGCGINIANRTPSICLLDVIDRCRPIAPAAVNPRDISIARVIPIFLNQLEHLIDRIRHTPSGHSWALALYTQCWLHSGQIVEVVSNSKEGEEEEASELEPCRCRILGLDDFGFLQAKDLRDGTVYSLHPDGNSMDMMHGLIRPK